MPLSLLPRYRARSVADISPVFVRGKGIRLLMLDFDNTIVPYTTSTPTSRMEQWLQQMLASDIAVCVVSNSRKSRVQVFCKQYLFVQANS